MNPPLEYQLRDKRRPDEPARLWGYERGREIRAELESLLDNAPTGSAVLVNMEHVEVMDASFCAEVFGRLLSSMGSIYPGKALVLLKPNEYVKENLDAALKSKGLMALVVEGPRKWTIVGKSSEADKPTLEALRKRKQATAPELAKDLNLNLTAANQRLRKLSDAGTIIRTKMAATSGGEQFMYEWPA